ncbi:MAG TPA: MFS transporter [Candidatus Saccharimonadales bacterium]|nr:MFS transporter [Candidatus Saccharimonadales bacterium]
MIRRFIHHILRRRHFWRHVGFDELSELYVSTMLRSMSLSLIGIFVPIYLYKLGYDLQLVFLFMICMFVSRMFSDVLSGFLVARFGPKHVMLLSYIMQILSLALLLNLSHFKDLLWPSAIVYGLANSLFFIAYHVDFSKIIHADHGGKELGYMTILERIGAAAGPLAGGLVAAVFGAEYTIEAAIVLLAIAVVPLFMSAEPVRLKQKLRFRGLPFRALWRDFISFAAFGNSNTISVAVWPLYIAVVIFTVNTYAVVGLVTSISIVTAIVSARLIGQLIDKRRGRQLLSASVFGGSILHLIRLMTMGFGGVTLVGMADQALTSGYKMPYSKGMYDRADSLPGYRIAYLVTLETIGDSGKVSVWLLAWLASFYLPATTAMQLCFVMAAAVILLIRLERFKVLKP